MTRAILRLHHVTQVHSLLRTESSPTENSTQKDGCAAACLSQGPPAHLALHAAAPFSLLRCHSVLHCSLLPGAPGATSAWLTPPLLHPLGLKTCKTALPHLSTILFADWRANPDSSGI